MFQLLKIKGLRSMDFNSCSKELSSLLKQGVAQQSLLVVNRIKISCFTEVGKENKFIPL